MLDRYEEAIIDSCKILNDSLDDSYVEYVIEQCWASYFWAYTVWIVSRARNDRMIFVGLTCDDSVDVSCGCRFACIRNHICIGCQKFVEGLFPGGIAAESFAIGSARCLRAIGNVLHVGFWKFNEVSEMILYSAEILPLILF